MLQESVVIKMVMMVMKLLLGRKRRKRIGENVKALMVLSNHRIAICHSRNRINFRARQVYLNLLPSVSPWEVASASPSSFLELL